MPQELSALSRRSLLAGVAGSLAGLVARSASAYSVRRLTLVRPATGEAARDVPFWRAGAPDDQGLAKLNRLMRDVRAEQVQPIDLRVYYLLAMVQAEFGGRPVLVTSGYRTRATNERLRQQGIDAARNSYHLRGRAVDARISGVDPADMATVGHLLGLGGVGVYAAFVHLDTGPRRPCQRLPPLQSSSVCRSRAPGSGRGRERTAAMYRRGDEPLNSPCSTHRGFERARVMRSAKRCRR